MNESNKKHLCCCINLIGTGLETVTVVVRRGCGGRSSVGAGAWSLGLAVVLRTDSGLVDRIVLTMTVEVLTGVTVADGQGAILWLGLPGVGVSVRTVVDRVDGVLDRLGLGLKLASLGFHQGHLFHLMVLDTGGVLLELKHQLVVSLHLGVVQTVTHGTQPLHLGLVDGLDRQASGTGPGLVGEGVVVVSLVGQDQGDDDELVDLLQFVAVGLEQSRV
ncbi:hypothetical protein WICPIJ_006678 [Wickerhamomyces pijperi]|uniref:Uncharacterized protein n=1 Tax=Wickerhamomyces pijperi TaxID=599730 RepID=A0A9P8Q402_WICPI|nr:hypothetical protein WICPIJ_006678 [Wickerhamomyces pijperi]